MTARACLATRDKARDEELRCPSMSCYTGQDNRRRAALPEHVLLHLQHAISRDTGHRHHCKERGGRGREGGRAAPTVLTPVILPRPGWGGVGWVGWVGLGWVGWGGYCATHPLACMKAVYVLWSRILPWHAVTSRCTRRTRSRARAETHQTHRLSMAKTVPLHLTSSPSRSKLVCPPPSPRRRRRC